MGWTTPKSFVVGEQATSADLNTYVRDNGDFLAGLPYDVWWNYAYRSGWSDVASGNSPGQARFIGDIVHLRGWIQCSIGAGNVVCDTLLHPTHEWNFQVIAANGTSWFAGRIDITTSGEMHWFGGSATTMLILLDGLQYQVAI